MHARHLLGGVITGLATVFLFILPIPGTIALRHALLLPLLILCAVVAFKPSQKALWQHGEKRYLAWLAVLTLWIYVQAFWISEETAWALGEINSQWIRALYAALLGVGLVLVARKADLKREKLFAWLIGVMLAQALFSLLITVPDFMANGVFPQGHTRFTAGKLEISYWNNLLMAFLAGDALSRYVFKQRLSALPWPILAAGMALVFISNLLFGARNGVIGSILLLVSLLALLLLHLRKTIGGKQLFGIGAGLLLLAGTLTFINIKLDSRWQVFGETARIAWDIENHDAWFRKDSSMPLLSSGAPVDSSAYERIAWIRAGLDLIQDYPQGVGYGRNAFGHALRKTRDSKNAHSHSGMIDWTVGTGIPGLLLWIGFMGALAWQGGRRYFVEHDVAGLVLFFVITGFFGRMFLDSINRDHLLMVFFLLVGILVTATRPEKDGKS